MGLLAFPIMMRTGSPGVTCIKTKHEDAIERPAPFASTSGRTGQKSTELLEQLRRLAGQGIQRVVGAVPRVEHITPLEAIGREIIRAAAAL
jgi:hypothetical protein